LRQEARKPLTVQGLPSEFAHNVMASCSGAFLFVANAQSKIEYWQIS
jgi:hypothetical protein